MSVHPEDETAVESSLRANLKPVIWNGGSILGENEREKKKVGRLGGSDDKNQEDELRSARPERKEQTNWEDVLEVATTVH